MHLEKETQPEMVEWMKSIHTLRESTMAMAIGAFISDFPIKPPFTWGFSIAMFDFLYTVKGVLSIQDFSGPTYTVFVFASGQETCSSDT